MTSNRAYKRRIRERQQSTGETYTQARVALERSVRYFWGLDRLLDDGTMTAEQVEQVEALHRRPGKLNLLVASNSTLGKSNVLLPISEHRQNRSPQPGDWLTVREAYVGDPEPGWGLPNWWTGDPKTSVAPSSYKEFFTVEVSTPPLAHMMATFHTEGGFIASIEGISVEEAVQTFNTLVAEHANTNRMLPAPRGMYKAVDAVILVHQDHHDRKYHGQPKVISVTDLRQR